MISGAAIGDDWSDTVFLSQEQLALRAATAVYPDRWCVKTFVRSNRGDLPDRQSSAFIPGDGSYLLPTNSPLYSNDSSLASRLIALRTMRLATLWRGRNQALVVGLSKSGYLGIRLDEVYASSR